MEGAMQSPRNAASQYFNTSTSANSAYNLVCNRCLSAPKFSHFDDFMEHSKSEHGPILRRSALSIIPESNDEHKLSNKGSVSHLSARSAISTTYSNSTTSNASSMFNFDFDLCTLSRACLMELIQLLNKCLCIWHRPTRTSVPRSERFHAYQLLLLKLRAHLPFATFRDVRSIVRQLIRNYVKQSKEAKERISKRQLPESSTTQELQELQQQSKEDSDNELALQKQQPTQSKTIINELRFLRNADSKDVEELVQDRLCAFCQLGFQNTETLWTHMVSAHLSSRKLKPQRSCSQQEALPEPCAATTDSAPDTSSLGRRRQRSRSNSRQYSDCETDYYSEASATDMEQMPLRRSRRRKRTIWRNIQYGCTNSRSPTRRAKRKPAAPVEQNKSDTEHKRSAHFLGDFSDAFLEQFIELYRQHDCLWLQNSKQYRNRKVKAAAYDALVKCYCQARNVPTVSLTKIKQLIRRLRGYYERLNRPNANQQRSHIWQQLAFIDQGRRCTRRSTTSSNIISDYDCSMCLRHFKRAKNFASHMLKSHPPTGCPPCKENFSNADELKRHLLGVHRKDQQCPLCHEPLQDWMVSAHLGKHFYEHKCPTCTQIYHDINNFQRHKLQCRSRNRFKCSHCNLKFSSTLDFRRHAKASHQDERPFKCDDCEISFKYMAPLTKHRQLHKRLRHYY